MQRVHPTPEVQRTFRRLVSAPEIPHARRTGPWAESGRFLLGTTLPHLVGFEVSDAVPEDTLQLDKGPGVPRGIAT